MKTISNVTVASDFPIAYPGQSPTAAYAALGSDERFSASLWLAESMWGDLEGGEAL